MMAVEVVAVGVGLVLMAAGALAVRWAYPRPAWSPSGRFHLAVGALMLALAASSAALVVAGRGAVSG